MSNDFQQILLDNQSDERKLSGFLNHTVFPLHSGNVYLQQATFYLSGFGVIHPSLLTNSKVQDPKSKSVSNYASRFRSISFSTTNAPFYGEVFSGRPKR
jgi:hypothetical protein